MNFIDPKGLWTGELGFAGNAQLGFVNFNGAIGIVFDGHGNVAYYHTTGGGVGVGLGVVGGFSGGWSNGDSINDFAGLFSSTNVSLGAVVDGSLEGFFGPGSKGQFVSGNSVTIGPGVGGGYSGGFTYTKLEPTSWINVLLQLPPSFDLKKVVMPKTDTLKGCP